MSKRVQLEVTTLYFSFVAQIALLVFVTLPCIILQTCLEFLAVADFKVGGLSCFKRCLASMARALQKCCFCASGVVSLSILSWAILLLPVFNVSINGECLQLRLRFYMTPARRAAPQRGAARRGVISTPQRRYSHTSLSNLHMLL